MGVEMSRLNSNVCRAAVEALEGRRLMSVAVPDGYVFIESLNLPASNAAKSGPEPITTTNDLEEGVEYFVRVTGPHQIARRSARKADAAFYQQKDTLDWVKGGQNVSVPGVSDWGAVRDPQAQYGAFIQGTGGKLTAQITDSRYDDNAGSETLEIYVKPRLAVTELSYDAASGGDHHDLIDDYDQQAYSGQHWLDANEDGDADDHTDGDQAFPTAYVSGGTMKVGTKFKIEGLGDSSATPNVQIKGTGPDGVTFEATDATILSGYAEATLTAASAFTADLVRYFESFSIDWEASTDGGQTWEVAGTTENEVCVLFAEPSTEDLFFSVVAVTTKAADGATSKQAVIDKAWHPMAAGNWEQRARNEGSTRPAKLPRQLTYWKSDFVSEGGVPVRHNNNTWKKLLESESGDGDCVAWSQLFQIMVRSHGADAGVGGLDVRLIAVLPNHTSSRIDPVTGQFYSAQMMFNSFTFVVNPAVQRNDGWSYRAGEYTDEVGFPAHGNQNPHAFWIRHMIVMVNDKLYDPSYGMGPFNSRTAWENRVLAGTRAYRPIGEPGLVEAVKRNVEAGADEKDVVMKEYLENGNYGAEVGN